jgi:riboflavin kinase/FMN adenylyltransferase
VTPEPREKPNVIQGLDDLPADVRGGAVCIGNFDGVHRGHQRIVRTAATLARPDGLPVVAVTFDPPPDLVLRPEDVPQRLTTPATKARRLLEAGADRVVIVPATRELLSREPERFVEEVLVGRFEPRYVVEGPNFFFGRRRAGDVALLGRLGPRFGYRLEVVQPVQMDIDGEVRRVSSTTIRGLLAEGRVADAAAALGHLHEIVGPVVRGDGMGRRMHFPTVNVEPGGQMLPADGVYAGRADLAGRTCAAAVSVGTKPTFGQGPRLLEAHLLDAEGDFYGQEASLRFVEYLRPQHTYAGRADLAGQIERDVQRVRELCS